MVVLESHSIQSQGSEVTLIRFDSAFSPLSAEAVVNTTTWADAVTPRIASLDDGGLVVAWANGTGNNNVHTQQLTASGAPDGTQQEVTAGGGTCGHDPVLAPHTGGGFTVYYGHVASCNSSLDHDVFSRKYDASGAPVGGQSQLNDSDAGWQRGPVAAVRTSDGAIGVAWSDDAVDGDGDGVAATFLDGNGTKMGVDKLANTAVQPGDQVALDMGAAGNEWLLLLADDTAAKGEPQLLVQRFSAIGLVSGAALEVADASGETPIRGRLAVFGDGGFMVCYAALDPDGQTDSDVYVRFFDPDGASEGAPIRVNTTTSGIQQAPACATLPYSPEKEAVEQAAVVWESDHGNGFDVYGSIAVRP